MHPRGTVLAARLTRLAGGDSGAGYLDGSGQDAEHDEHDVLVRFSRSLGWGAPLPDVNGLAVRVPRPGDAEHPYADVLMSTTGRGRWSRYSLVPTLHERGPFLGTLLPHRSPTGPVHLGAQAVGATTWELSWARPRETWRPYARLELDDVPGIDLALTFDAVRIGPPGLEVYGWHRAVRGPSYAAARRSRGL